MMRLAMEHAGEPNVEALSLVSEFGIDGKFRGIHFAQ